MKLYNVNREFVFLIAFLFQDIQWQNLGQLFASAWFTPEQVKVIETRFPNTIFAQE